MNFEKEKELEDKKINDIKNGNLKSDNANEGPVNKDDRKSVMYYG